MKEDILRKAQLLQGDIYQAEQAISDMNKVLEDYDKFGSSITFLRNSDGFSRSFGSKKYNFRKEMKVLLEGLLANTKVELQELKKQFEVL